MKYTIYILVILFLFSCKKDNLKKPENFIPKDKMVTLLVDMSIANKTRNIKNKDLKKGINYMSYVFEKYNIDSTQFKDNNEYYVHHITQYQDIYIEVEKRLKDSLNKYEKKQKLEDSLAQKKKSLLKEKKMVESNSSELIKKKPKKSLMNKSKK